MSVDVTATSGRLRAGTAKPLYKQTLVDHNWRNSYAVSPDGKRFLMMVPAGKAKTPPITVAVNWTASLKKQ